MAQQDKCDLDQAMENYQKGVDLDPSNAQCKQMLEQSEAQLMQRMMGGMGICQEWAAWRRNAMRWRRAFQCCSSGQVEDEPKDCKVL
jgi:hypothetical protein